MTTTIRNYVVYRNTFGYTEYLASMGRFADTCTWSIMHSQAQRFTQTEAFRLARKFNKSCDRRQYGWAHETMPY